MRNSLFRGLATTVLATLIILAFIEFHQVAYGTGDWLWQYSPKWFALTMGTAFVSLLALIAGLIAIWAPGRLDRLGGGLKRWREQNRAACWLIAAVLIIVPLWLLARTEWGLLLTGFSSRFMILSGMTVATGLLLTRSRQRLLDFRGLVIALILCGTGAAIAVELSNVTDYPFSLYWSEGNRIWDYSLMFGRGRYVYPAGLPIPAYIDQTRQFLWGLVFLLPDATITEFRLWNAVLYILPHILFGWAAFRTAGTRAERWLLALWAYLFLTQGGIYTPIILIALLVALVWNRRWWIAIPGMALATYLAYISRITWVVGPATWALLLVMGHGTDGLRLRQIPRRWTFWLAALTLGAAAVLAGFLAFHWSGLMELIGRQPLLWERLLPNPTYARGILLGLLLAVGPLAILVGYVFARLRPRWPAYRLILMAAAVLGLLAIGLLVSVKIGGGADLHNLDLFLIGLVFLAAATYKRERAARLGMFSTWPAWMRIVLVLSILIPAFQQIDIIQPKLHGSERLSFLLKKKVGDDTALLPTVEETNLALGWIREEVNARMAMGEILFMDQRQLLTFRNVPSVPLVPPYEKKRMIDEAMSANLTYFAPYYRDLAARRFSLIVTEKMMTDYMNPILDDFSQEGNAWVTWVSEPTLCFYEPVFTLEELNLDLLVPRSEPVGCERYLAP